MRVLPSVVAPVLGVATALLVACGGDGRIPSSDASRVENALNEVSADFRAGNCQAAEQAVARARGALLNLPESVDQQLRDRLRAGVTQLSARVPQTCGQAQTQPEQAQPPATTEPQTTETQTTDTQTTTTETTTTETQPTQGTGTTTGESTGTGGTDTGTGGTPPPGDGGG